MVRILMIPSGPLTAGRLPRRLRRSFGPMKLQIGLGPVMQRVAREIRRRRQIEMDIAVADVALEQVGPARDIEPELLTPAEPHRSRREAERQRDRFAWRQRLAHAGIDSDLARRAARLIDPAARRT